MTAYLVSKFQRATISALIRECFGYDFSDIQDHQQLEYIFNYLNVLGATSVLLEPGYVDKDFLEDFSRYYVKRFNNDGHLCGRLHFFSCHLDHRRINGMLTNSSGGLTPEALQDAYLGFMVVKPLPKTFIGKTCLRVASEPVHSLIKRKERLTKRYAVNLFGVDLHVDSVAFQEQDRVVAACATTAIWSALHSLSWLDVRDVPSCSEITTSAINYIHGSHNSFPNKELTNKQIQRALDIEGLRYHSATLENMEKEAFLSSVESYINSKSPVIIMGMVYGVNGNELESKARHAICVTGYNVSATSKALYVHDDRLGPYARAEISSASAFSGPVAEALKDRLALLIQSRKEDKSWKAPHEIIVPDMSIVPADKKARLPFSFAYETAANIQEELAEYGTTNQWFKDINSTGLEFSIKLSTISDIRRDIRGHIADRDCETPFDAGSTPAKVGDADYARWGEAKLQLLTSGMARLQWVISFRCAQLPIFKVFIDATDIPQGDAVSAVYVENILTWQLFSMVFNDQSSLSSNVAKTNFYNSFLRSLKDREEDYFKHLDKTYGPLRAPSELKDGEVNKDGKGSNETTKRFYEASPDDLQALYPESVTDPFKNLIWAIGKEGELYVGVDIKIEPIKGHPSMTGMQPARIAGEMWWCASDGAWKVNAESGRYSRDYPNAPDLLDRAVEKISVFFGDSFHTAPGYRPAPGQP
jgi:hypothetical protein